MTTPQPPAEPTKAQETPRTDDFFECYTSGVNKNVADGWKLIRMADFARTLERELAAMTQELGEVQNRKIEACIAWTEAQDQLAAARAKVEQLDADLTREIMEKVEAKTERDTARADWQKLNETKERLRARLTQAEADANALAGALDKATTAMCSAKFDTLILWLDQIDREKGLTGTEVQDELRDLEAALSQMREIAAHRAKEKPL